ncbi:V-type ATP synthase subunit F [Salinispira pacifica]
MEFHVLAEEEVVVGFRFVGVPGTPVATPEEALDAFRDATSPERDVRVLILTEEVSAMIEEEVLDWQASGDYPLIVEIPGLRGRMEGKRSLVDAIREAVGIHV